MSNILDELKERLATAQKALNETNAILQSAQAQHAQAVQAFNVWNMAVQMVQREEQQRQATVEKQQIPLSSASPAAGFPPEDSDHSQASDTEESATGKTELVRNLLQQHPTGMTAPDIWKAVSAQFKHRPYLYSVLKRLRDRDEVAMRRNKYYPKLVPAPQGTQEEQQVIH